jgi:hypothetical protein
MATIESRTTSFRAKIRLRGFPAQTATFGRLTDAKRWSQATEAAIREGRYFKTVEAKRHTLGEAIDGYIREVLPHRPRNSRNTKAILSWWKKQLALVEPVAEILYCRARLAAGGLACPESSSF